MVRRLAETAETRTRLFDTDDTLLADSRILLGKDAKVQVETLALSEERPTWADRLVGGVFDVIDLIHERRTYPLYEEQEIQRADQNVVAGGHAGHGADVGAVEGDGALRQPGEVGGVNPRWPIRRQQAPAEGIVHEHDGFHDG